MTGKIAQGLAAGAYRVADLVGAEESMQRLEAEGLEVRIEEGEG
jgi:hypothetical protein